jgi:hypothetical protein
MGAEMMNTIPASIFVLVALIHSHTGGPEKAAVSIGAAITFALISIAWAIKEHR